MFSADMSWTPMVDEISVESRDKAGTEIDFRRGSSREKLNDCDNDNDAASTTGTFGAPRRSTSQRWGASSSAAADADSIKSSGSQRSRLFRWAASRSRAARETGLPQSPEDETPESASPWSATPVHQRSISAPIMMPLPPEQPVLAEMPEDRGSYRHELPTTPRLTPRRLETLVEERSSPVAVPQMHPVPPVPAIPHSYRLTSAALTSPAPAAPSHVDFAASRSVPLTIRRDFQSRRTVSEDSGVSASPSLAHSLPVRRQSPFDHSGGHW